jgi:hypothetical protein
MTMFNEAHPLAEIPESKTRAIATLTGNAMEAATKMLVVDSDSYLAGCLIVKAWAAIDKQIDEAFDPDIKRANDLVKSMRETKKRYSNPLGEARTIAEGKLLSWKREDDARVAREREAAQAVARKEAEAQRKRELESLRKAGMRDMAKELKSVPVMVPTVSIPSAPKVTGVSTVKTWKAEVTDLRLLVQAVAKDGSLIHLLKPDQPALNEMARRQKENLALPGVMAVCNESMSVRSGGGDWPDA